MMLYGLSPETISSIQGVLANHPHVQQAILYGSRAKGNERPGSDIDLTLKGERLSYDELNQIAWELDELCLPYKIDLSLYALLDHVELLAHIDRVGVLFYEPQPATQITV
jgi:uncharacterized protein